MGPTPTHEWLAMLFLLLIALGGARPKVKVNATANNTTNTTIPPPAAAHDAVGVPPSPAPLATSNSVNESHTEPPPPPPPPPPKVTLNHTPSATPPVPVPVEKPQENERDAQSQSITSHTCHAFSVNCQEGPILACISHSASEYVEVIVQNKGDHKVNVKLEESNIGEIEVAEHQNKKINVSVTSSETAELTLNIGKEKCVLQLRTPVPVDGNYFRSFSYEKVLTPVNGAYFLIVVVVIFGGTWACCKFRKKRHEGVPYQELEMALPEAASAEAAEGWDQDWDDNWDDDVAVKSAGRSHAGSISANGLTARSSNRDGWENDWDD